MSRKHVFTPNGLPWEPEPVEKIQARFAASLAPVYEVYDAARAIQLKIGRQRKHVFDLENGFRIICSIERYGPGAAPNLHISFSTILGRDSSGGMSGKQIIGYFHQVAKEISRGRLDIAEVKVTENGIVHFYYEPNAILGKLDDQERKQLSNWVGRGKAA